MSQVIRFQPIGLIHSPFQQLEQMPIQPATSSSADGYAQIFPEYVPGLKDLDGFSHVFLLYHLHKSPRADLTVTPFLDQEPRGIFATRAPTRPNPIGLSVTVRGERMWVFLDRLVNAALPRIRDFRGVSPKAFDGRGNFSLGIREQLIFPEIEYDKVDRVRGLQVNIITTARNDEEGTRLLELLGMPFSRS